MKKLESPNTNIYCWKVSVHSADTPCVPVLRTRAVSIFCSISCEGRWEETRMPALLR
jgi:hypothetical protein